MQGPRILPTFKGYSIDVRCRQFRKAHFCKDGSPGRMEFIDFDSEEGDKLLVQLVKKIDKRTKLWKEICSIF